MPQPSVAGQIPFNAPAGIVSWTNSIRCKIPGISGDILFYMVHQGAPTKLDRPYALSAPALKYLDISTNNLKSAPVLRGTGHTLFCTCYGETRCPSKAGQTLRLECFSSQVAEHILPITYGEP